MISLLIVHKDNCAVSDLAVFYSQLQSLYHRSAALSYVIPIVRGSAPSGTCVRHLDSHPVKILGFIRSWLALWFDVSWSMVRTQGRATSTSRLGDKPPTILIRRLIHIDTRSGAFLKKFLVEE